VLEEAHRRRGAQRDEGRHGEAGGNAVDIRDVRDRTACDLATGTMKGDRFIGQRIEIGNEYADRSASVHDDLHGHASTGGEMQAEGHGRRMGAGPTGRWSGAVLARFDSTSSSMSLRRPGIGAPTRVDASPTSLSTAAAMVRRDA